MIKHIVMWKFKEGCEEKAKEFLAGLKSLYGQIPEIKSLEAGVSASEKNDCDAVLIACFETFADLEKYKNDPRHVAVSSLCKQIRIERHSADIVE